MSWEGDSNWLGGELRRIREQGYPVSFNYAAGLTTTALAGTTVGALVLNRPTTSPRLYVRYVTFGYTVATADGANFWTANLVIENSAGTPAILGSLVINAAAGNKAIGTIQVNRELVETTTAHHFRLDFAITLAPANINIYPGVMWFRDSNF
jgi:hypothetical protein